MSTKEHTKNSGSSSIGKETINQDATMKVKFLLKKWNKIKY
jgi:hypothetical protein